jgi:hypothetical protein
MSTHVVLLELRAIMLDPTAIHMLLAYTICLIFNAVPKMLDKAERETHVFPLLLEIRASMSPAAIQFELPSVAIVWPSPRALPSTPVQTPAGFDAYIMELVPAIPVTNHLPAPYAAAPVILTILAVFDVGNH